MSRGKRPVVAIGEAKRSAVAAGFMLIELVTAAVLPFDFVVHRDGTSSVVRVRRLKQAGFRIENILRACAQELKELRESTLLDGLIRELWVRGPARAYHRYRVLPETVEEIAIAAKPESPDSSPEKNPEIKTTGIPEDQNEQESIVREIYYTTGLPVIPEIPEEESDPTSLDGTANSNGSVKPE
jgi:hypothetical protein